MRFDAVVRSSGSGAIGVVLRWRDPDNFVFVYLQGELRMIARKLRGAFGSLSPVATQRGMSFIPGAPVHLAVTSRGSDVTVAVDGEPPFTGTDRALAGPGRVGFMCAHDPHATFSFLELREL
jgi:hypothetical protein